MSLPPYHSLSRLDYLLLRLQLELKKTSTLRIVIIAIVLHSLFSILLIHNYLNYYSDTYHRLVLTLFPGSSVFNFIK